MALPIVIAIPAEVARSRKVIRRILLTCLLGSLTLNPATAGWLDTLKGILDGDSTPATAPVAESLSADQIGGGLKEALRIGTETVVSNLGQTDGFNLDPAIHIPLPNELDKVKSVLEKVGMDGMLVDLETRLNRAAEIATPKAKALFVQSIQDMTLDDVMGIYEGPNDAATQYFRSKMATPLAAEMSPVVDESLSEAGAAQAYDSVMAKYNALPYAPKIDADLSSYVVDKGMDGIFFYLAKEEAAIRQNPAKRTTDLLKQVFGQ